MGLDLGKKGRWAMGIPGGFAPHLGRCSLVTPTPLSHITGPRLVSYSILESVYIPRRSSISSPDLIVSLATERFCGSLTNRGFNLPGRDNRSASARVVSGLGLSFSSPRSSDNPGHWESYCSCECLVRSSRRCCCLPAVKRGWATKYSQLLGSFRCWAASVFVLYSRAEARLLLRKSKIPRWLL